MIYDPFIFFNDLELLESRLHELDSVVGCFDLVNGAYPAYGRENLGRFQSGIRAVDSPRS